MCLGKLLAWGGEPSLHIYFATWTVELLNHVPSSPFLTQPLGVFLRFLSKISVESQVEVRELGSGGS